MVQHAEEHGFLRTLGVDPPMLVEFEFNPASISDNKVVNYVDMNSNLSGYAPGKQYMGGGHRTITFDLNLYGLEEGPEVAKSDGRLAGISIQLARLRSFLYPITDAWAGILTVEGRRLTSPPLCLFGFGNRSRPLECVVTDLSITETQFNPSLAPVKAEVRITLVVVDEAEASGYSSEHKNRNKIASADQ